MNKLFIYTFAILLLQGCSNETKLTEEDAILFLDEMEEFSAEEGPLFSTELLHLIQEQDGIFFCEFCFIRTPLE